MPVSIVVGGQYGSESKGKVTQYITNKYKDSIVVRVGGSNSGHTGINNKNEPIVLRQLPVSSLNKNKMCVLSPGSYINIEVLMKEIEITGIKSSELLIDNKAVIITDKDIELERSSDLGNNISSTLSGNGQAVINRVSRTNKIITANNVEILKPYLCDTTDYLRKELNKNKRIIIEGNQGFGLSNLHSKTYPYVTSRDTTAASFLSEVGLSPLDVDQIWLVLRTFPIRVGGNSGPLKYETNWKTVSRISGISNLTEYTSVTNKIRRVGYFDSELVKDAIMYNTPTHIVLNHLDYIDKNCFLNNQLSKKALEFIKKITNEIEKKITHVGYSKYDLSEIFY